MDITDVWRTLNATACFAALSILVVRYLRNHKSWNQKTRHFWFALLVWTTAGFAGSIEQVFQGVGFGVRVVLLSVAVLISIKAILQKGHWGGEDT